MTSIDFALVDSDRFMTAEKEKNISAGIEGWKYCFNGSGGPE